MMLYLKDFAGWAYPNNPILLGLHADYDSWLGWRQETWEKSRLPKFASAAGPGVPVDRFKDFPRDRWCQIRITFDGKDSATFQVDGQTWGETRGKIFKGTKPLLLTVGPFKGSVDELRLRKGD
jgi:hypothetical protein